MFKTRRFVENSTITTSFACVSITTTVLLCLWDIAGKTKTLYRVIPTTSAAMDITADFLAATVLILNTGSTLILHHDKVKKNHNSFEKIDNFLQIAKSRNDDSKFVKICVHCAAFLTFAVDIYSRKGAYGWDNYKYNLAALFHLYRLQLFVLRIYNLTAKISKRFELLHQKVDKIVNSGDKDFAIPRLVTCMKCHYVLSKIMKNVSSLYGCQFVLVQKMLALYIVASIYFFYLVSHKGILLHIDEAFCYVLWVTIFLMICGFLLVFSCDRANNRATAVAKSCQDIIRMSSVDPRLKKLLKQFMRQIGIVNPKICYPDECRVSRKTFIRMTGNIINYLIIVFQFDN
ncbi:hypothetical protein Zmor_009483 [Zophobas morio]|uniref:Gustatory receptor n=1 Tax=Zophobas morio TaxID=2755281 RepID=A0AA38MIE1_9CUCU|nr:hypothetical protein Zmor_009483 [Zophobas morio]